MNKVILKVNEETRVIEDIGESYDYVPDGYIEVALASYPNDILCKCYKYINNEIIKDKALYKEYSERIEFETKNFKAKNIKGVAWQ